MPAPDEYAADVAAALAPFDPAAFAGAFTHHAAMIDGVKLHSVRGGTGPTLVLLHGWPASWYEFRKLIPLLAGRFTVLAPDLPGMGDSGPAADYRKAAVAGLVATLVERTGGGPVDLVGHDVGGPVAFALAAARPDLVRRLVLIETMLAGPEQDAMQAVAFPNLWHIAFNAAPGVAEFFTAGREAAYVGHCFHPWCHNPAAVGPADLAEYQRVYATPGKLGQSVGYYRTFRQDAAENEPYLARKLAQPTLHLVGDASMGAMGDAPYQSVAKYLADGRAEVVDRCGHWVAEERPAFLARRLTEFFAR